MSDGSRTRTLCPYTLSPLSSLPALSKEHIFPDALGGASSYVVQASPEINCGLGRTLDATLINSTLISALKLKHGIESRSGEPRWRVRGALPDSEIRAEAVFSPSGTDERILNPVQFSPDRRSGTITMTADKMQGFLDKFIEDNRRKGKQVVLGEETSLGCPPMMVDLRLDLLAIKQALLRIAYLGAFEKLGDEFLRDPLGAEWRRVILGQTREEVQSARLHGIGCDPGLALDIMIPDIKEHEHAFAIANLNQRGPVVAASLFGKGIHSVLVLASHTSNYDLRCFEGEIVICDACQRTVRRMPFEDHFARVAAHLPVDPPGLSG